jgi:hypothetical protein
VKALRDEFVSAEDVTGEPLVFCIDTDEWLYGKDYCYFSVVNSKDGD